MYITYAYVCVCVSKQVLKHVKNMLVETRVSESIWKYSEIQVQQKPNSLVRLQDPSLEVTIISFNASISATEKGAQWPQAVMLHQELKGLVTRW